MKLFLTAAILYQVFYNLPVHKRFASEEVHLQVLSGTGIGNKKIKRLLSHFKGHQRSSSVIFSFLCKTVTAGKITVMGNVKTKCLYYCLSAVCKFFDCCLVNIFCEKHSLFCKLSAFRNRSFHIFFIKTTVKLLYDLSGVHSLLKIRKHFICNFIYKMNASAVYIQNNVVAVALITVNQTHFS